MQIQKRIPKHTEDPPQEMAVEELPDVTASLDALDAAIKGSKKERKKAEQKAREERFSCCGLVYP